MVDDAWNGSNDICIWLYDVDVELEVDDSALLVMMMKNDEDALCLFIWSEHFSYNRIIFDTNSYLFNGTFFTLHYNANIHIYEHTKRRCEGKRLLSLVLYLNIPYQKQMNLNCWLIWQAEARRWQWKWVHAILCPQIQSWVHSQNLIPFTYTHNVYNLIVVKTRRHRLYKLLKSWLYRATKWKIWNYSFYHFLPTFPRITRSNCVWFIVYFSHWFDSYGSYNYIYIICGYSFLNVIYQHYRKYISD